VNTGGRKLAAHADARFERTTETIRERSLRQGGDPRDSEALRSPFRKRSATTGLEASLGRIGRGVTPMISASKSTK
jgi:hypothetical protein